MKRLSSLGISVFCENLAMMLSAGIPADNAMELLTEDTGTGIFHEAAKEVNKFLIMAEPLGSAIEKSECFPAYAVHMIKAGELSGRTEDVLRNLAIYYDGQNRLESKLRSAVVYPSAFLLVIAGILLLLITTVLPIFTGVYTNLVGDLTASSFSYINTSYVVGYTALAITMVLVIALLMMYAMSRSENGKKTLSGIFQNLPFTRATSYSIALSQFMAALSTFTASGVNTDTALEEAMAMVEHKEMLAKLNRCKILMDAGQSLAQAFQQEKLFDALYVRMMVSGAHSGQMEQVSVRLTQLFADETDYRLNRLIDIIEPSLAIFLTLSVGLTLISVMLPLIGILGAIG